MGVVTMHCNSRVTQGEGRDRRMVDLMATNLSPDFVEDLVRVVEQNTSVLVWCLHSRICIDGTHAQKLHTQAHGVACACHPGPGQVIPGGCSQAGWLASLA